MFCLGEVLFWCRCPGHNAGQALPSNVRLCICFARLRGAAAPGRCCCRCCGCWWWCCRRCSWASFFGVLRRAPLLDIFACLLCSSEAVSLVRLRLRISQSCGVLAWACLLAPRLRRFQSAWPRCCRSCVRSSAASAAPTSPQHLSWQAVPQRSSEISLLMTGKPRGLQTLPVGLLLATCYVSNMLAHANAICAVVLPVGQRIRLDRVCLQTITMGHVRVLTCRV